ncbi:MAG: phosphoadenylyl-sulfate reductase [Rhodospirillales bacterium]|nr:phosphoadenylyl-sulfate reductase [Rhodospirillales bacterium]
MPDGTTRALLGTLIRERFAGRIALVSSFGTESAVLLHMAAAIDRSLPVIFLDTGKLFAETLGYRDALAARLGLTDIRAARADPAPLRAADPDGTLWRREPDRCCDLRKAAPLAAALAPFDAWISGRKRFQGGERAALGAIEIGEDWRIKINPLAHWSAADIEVYFARHDLPPHPLLAAGYRSVGCAPCTRGTRPGEDARAGRWDGIDKTECGIHRSPAFAGRISA